MKHFIVEMEKVNPMKINDFQKVLRSLVVELDKKSSNKESELVELRGDNGLLVSHIIESRLCDIKSPYHKLDWVTDLVVLFKNFDNAVKFINTTKISSLIEQYVLDRCAIGMPDKKVVDAFLCKLILLSHTLMSEIEEIDENAYNSELTSLYEKLEAFTLSTSLHTEVILNYLDNFSLQIIETPAPKKLKKDKLQEEERPDVSKEFFEDEAVRLSSKEYIEAEEKFQKLFEQDLPQLESL